MLVKDFGTAFRIVPGPPGRGLNKNFHPARIEHAKQAEAEQTAKSFLITPESQPTSEGDMAWVWF